MKMRIKYLFLLFAFILMGAASCKNKSKKPAHLQFISMVPSKAASFSISPVSGDTKRLIKNLGYAKPGGYKKFEPGQYRIRYAIENRTVLDHTFTLGSDSYQTLLATGLWRDSLSVNPKTNSYAIKRIVAGSETLDPNGFYPQFLMLRDKYHGSTHYGLVRFVHAAPFKKTLTIKNNGKSLASGLKYPIHTEPAPKKKALDLSFMMGSISLKKMNSSIDQGYMKTIIIGDNPSGEEPLTINSYKTITTSLQKKR